MRLPITALLLSAAIFPLAGSADAASLTSGKKLEIRVDEAKVEEEKKALWGKFGGWCAIAEWHPAVKKCEETPWHRGDSRRGGKRAGPASSEEPGP